MLNHRIFSVPLGSTRQGSFRQSVVESLRRCLRTKRWSIKAPIAASRYWAGLRERFDIRSVALIGWGLHAATYADFLRVILIHLLVRRAAEDSRTRLYDLRAMS